MLLFEVLSGCHCQRYSITKIKCSISNVVHCISLEAAGTGSVLVDWSNHNLQFILLQRRNLHIETSSIVRLTVTGCNKPVLSCASFILCQYFFYHFCPSALCQGFVTVHLKNGASRSVLLLFTSGSKEQAIINYQNWRRVWGSGDITPHTFNLVTRWSIEFSFTFHGSLQCLQETHNLFSLWSV